jgi:hypothetical protein
MENYGSRKWTRSERQKRKVEETKKKKIYRGFIGEVSANFCG